MSTRTLALLIKSLALLVAISFVACEGDLGPQGPAGPAGPAGPQGVAGQDGQNGAENCIDCHGNNQLITAKVFQWENSVHYLGGNFTRNRTSCAICHTSQGFRERIETGAMETAADIDDPLPQNCYTCHRIHETYTEADWAFTVDEPVTLWVGGATVDVGKGNVCISCHQPRLRDPDVPPVGSTDSVTITSSRWGPHHGAQGALFTGEGAYEIGDGYTNSSHSNLLTIEGCIQCHMAPVMDGRAAGGHTFRVETEDGELNTNGCVECHSDEDALVMLKEETQATLEAALEELRLRLIEVGILTESDRAVQGTWGPVEAGCLWNYFYLLEDQSYGIHNFSYAMKLIENSLEALN